MKALIKLRFNQSFTSFFSQSSILGLVSIQESSVGGCPKFVRRQAKKCGVEEEGETQLEEPRCIYGCWAEVGLQCESSRLSSSFPLLLPTCP